MTVSAEVDADHNINLVSRQLQNQLDEYETPEGYSLSIVGENETIVNTVSDLLQMVGRNFPPGRWSRSYSGNAMRIWNKLLIAKEIFAAGQRTTKIE